jgi:glycosyltransferase involved in cell wall biosynthesis
MKITFLAHSLDHIGGITRATLTTASALAARHHHVEIAAMFRKRLRPIFTIDPRVRVVSLTDDVADPAPPDRGLAGLPSLVYPTGDTFYGDVYNRLTDTRIADFLHGCDSDVIVGTTPGINVYLARFAPPDAVTVAQEHMFYEHHETSLRAELSAAYREVGAVVTVSEHDADNHRRALPHLAHKIICIPNSVPGTEPNPSAVDTKTIVAAGRLEEQKNFPMLLNAFAQVHRSHPDWRLRIYGDGSHAGRLRAHIAHLGLTAHAELAGPRCRMEAEWSKGQIAAVTSDFESFGLTVVEAMQCGLPVVSTACRYGPPEIIDHGVDGLLTPVGDTDAFAAALCHLIGDRAMRERMARACRAKARKYRPAEIVNGYERLFQRLRATEYLSAA